MNESIAIGKEADAKKGFSSTRSSDKSINRTRNEPVMQLGSLGAVIGNIRRDGGKPSVESIATQLSDMPTGVHAPALLALQQTHGNRYVQRVVSGIQAKLNVGQPGDKYEQEADRVADAVMRMPEPGVQRQVEEEEEEELVQPKLVANAENSIQRQVEEEEEEELLQTKELTGHKAEITPDLESRIQAIRGGGQPLPESVRAYFEPRFGYDFSQVRTHTDAQAAESARAANARAFTVGRDVVFGAGQYTPGTSEGRRLMAHELTHVVQQRTAASSANTRRAIMKPSDALEWEAMAVEQAVTSGQPIPSISESMTSCQIAKQDEPDVSVPTPKVPEVGVPAPKEKAPAVYTPTDFRQDIQIHTLRAVDSHRVALNSFKGTLKQTEVKGFKIVMDKTLSFAIGKIPVYGGAIATSYDILNTLYGEYQNVSRNIKASEFAQKVSDRVSDAKKKAMEEATRIGKVCNGRWESYKSDPAKIDELKRSMSHEAKEIEKKIPETFAIEKALYESWVNSKKWALW